MRAMRPSWMGSLSEEQRRDREVGAEQVRLSLLERYASRAAAGLPVCTPEDRNDGEYDVSFRRADRADSSAAVAV